MKKEIAIILLVSIIGLLTACGKTTENNIADVDKNTNDTSVEIAEAFIDPVTEWSQYDELIEKIKKEKNFEKRIEEMHQAEDMLMATGAILPLYYYNDAYMQKQEVTGVYTNSYGYKYFMYASNGNDTNMNICLASEPNYMDPALNSSLDGSSMAINCFAGLYGYDENGEVIPDLAESYKMSEDSLTYTFTMKQNLKWSDGTPLTAKDVVYSWNRAVAPETAADYRYMFSSIDGYEEGKLRVTALDDVTLEVVMNMPCAYFLNLLALPVFYPVQQKCVEASATETQPGAWAYEAGYVTSGAYVVSEWKHNEYIILKKNPYFWNADRVKLETLTFMLNSDVATSYSAYQLGDLDFTDLIPTDELKGLVENKNPEFHLVDQLGTYYIVFNVKSDLFKDKTPEQAAAMRMAFSYLIDRQYIIDDIAQCGQQAATSFIPARMSDGNGGIFKNKDYYNPEYSDENLEKARHLLEYAGYKFADDGMLSESTPISFSYLTNDISGNGTIAEAIQSDLAEVGIDMKIDTREWNVFLAERNSGNYSVARAGWMANFDEPISMLEMWTSSSNNNSAQFGK